MGDKNMRKIIKLGTTKAHNGRRPIDVPVYCKIEITTESAGPRLSISGVEGPKSNGGAYGGWGQIVLHHLKDRGASIEPHPGWSADSIARFLETWKRWHLNDMRAGCEHQRTIDVTRKIELVIYGITHEAQRDRDKAIAYAAKESASGRTPQLTETDRALVLLDDWFRDRFAPPDADSPLSGCFEAKKREQKAIGWVSPNEHPEGMLSKPCATCGYKYGSAWLYEEIPADVLVYLESLPDSPDQPAWV